MREWLYWYVIRPAQRLPVKVAYLMPRWLAYWCAIRVTAHATTGKYGNQIVSDLTAMDALDRWEK